MSTPGTTWFKIPRMIREPVPAGVKLWENDPEARIILQDCHRRPPRMERDTVNFTRTSDEFVRFTGHRAARLQAIYDRYLDETMARADRDAFMAQDHPAHVIWDAIEAAEAVQAEAT